jgi:ribonuclease R
VPLGGGGPLHARGWSRVGARDGDLVLAEPSGVVVKVLRQGDHRAVGTVDAGGSVRLLRTNRRLYVAPRRGKNLPPGRRVLVGLPDASRFTCALLDVLGPEGELDIEVQTALLSRGFDRSFAPQVEREAEAVADMGMQKEDTDVRVDLRSLLVFTIDPHDAQDFDDGLSAEPLGNGGLRLGVHIADVSHFVRTGTDLDEEAFRRAFSVYPPGSVVPMLPDRLSGTECSLLEGQPRRAFSVFLEYDGHRRLRNTRMIPSLVQSRARTTYADVQHLLEAPRARDRLGRAIRSLQPLVRTLRESRAVRGGLDLDTGEAKIVLDDDGQPASVGWSRRLESYDVVEECMIAANCAVAQRLRALGWPALYRIHAKPGLDSLQRLAELLSPLGYQLRDPLKLEPRDLQDLLLRVRGTKHERLVSYLVLRSLPKALYSAVNHGHYGLALERYLHFTSPIRRYPDLVVHRLLKSAVAGRGPGSLPEEERLGDIADACSYREELALEAERDVQAVYLTAYMKSRLGESFRGMVVGAEPFGVFVELDDLPVQGMIPAGEFREPARPRRRRSRIRGSDRTAELGQEVIVKVVRADIARRHVEFSLA